MDSLQFTACPFGPSLRQQEESNMSLTIEVRFLGGLTPSQEAVFTSAAERWMEIITEDLPSVRFGGETITGVRIDAQGQLIDGPGTGGRNVLGQASPSAIRSNSLLPAAGFMQFDSFDLSSLEANGQLEDVIIHEMGHVLGIGSLWQRHGLVRQAGTNNPVFLGRAAAAEWSALIGQTEFLTAAPIANMGGAGSAGAHWRESELRNELMSPSINPGVNPISRLTIASLQDLGYTVNLDAAESFQLPSAPNLVALDEDANPNARSIGCSCGSLQRPPTDPIELPEE